MTDEVKPVDEETVKKLKAEALDLEAKISAQRKKLKEAETPKDEAATLKRLEKLEGDLTALRDEIRALKPAAPAGAAAPVKSDWPDWDE